MKREIKQLVGLSGVVKVSTEWDWYPAQTKTVRDSTDPTGQRVLMITSSGILVTRGTTCVGVPMDEFMKLVLQLCPEFTAIGGSTPPATS